MHRHKRAVIFAAASLLCMGMVGTARAQTTMQVRLGWEGYVRADRWNLAFVTLSDPRPRNVTVEFHTPYDRFQGNRIGQGMTIGPQPQTFPLYVPLRAMNVEDLSIIVRDASTRKRLATYPPGPVPVTGGLAGLMTDPARSFVGISGGRSTLRSITRGLPGALLEAGYLDPSDLPTDAIGFDAVDILVLNAPNLSALADEQQQAIADWVRAGGNLVLWPSDDPVPASGPLVDVLPCRIGDSAVTDLSPELLEKAGLPARFRKLPGRRLSPVPGATGVTLLGTNQLTAYRRRVGFGRVVVCPTDLAGLMFAKPQDAWRTWRPLLDGMLANLPDPEAAATDPERTYGVNPTALRDHNGLRQIGDMLGTVPGAGRFGFGYVAGVLVGMMVVVGPVDWFVLKRLGRQPWTWVTTGGWIGLVTLGAVYAGHMLKSGELHFRTFEVVDQADDAAVASTTLAGLYSPRTTEYDVQTPVESWWQPAAPGEEYYGYGRSSGHEVGFHQTYRGNRPERMVVNVWNLRFLRGRTTRPGPPLVSTSLAVVRPAGDKPEYRLVGTVRNLGPTPLKNLAVRTKEGMCVFELRAAAANRVEPRQAVAVDAVIDPEMKPVRRNDPNEGYRGYYGNNQSLPPMLPTRLWETGGDLAARRVDLIARWLQERGDLACVYGEFEDPGPATRLAGATPIEKHYKVLRALVPLKREAASP